MIMRRGTPAEPRKQNGKGGKKTRREIVLEERSPEEITEILALERSIKKRG